MQRLSCHSLYKFFEFIWHCLSMVTAGFEPSIYKLDWHEFWYSGTVDSSLIRYTWGDWVLDWDYNAHSESVFNYYHEFNPLTKEWDFVWCGGEPVAKTPDPYDDICF